MEFRLERGEDDIYRSYSWLYFSPVFAKDYRKKRRKKKMKMRNNWNWPKTKSMSPTLVSFGIIHITKAHVDSVDE